MDEKKQKNHDILKWVVFGLLGVVVITLVFGAGVAVGEKKAKFSYRWAEQYHNMFAGPRQGFLGDFRNFPRGEFIESRGSFGEIIKINDTDFVINGQNNTEKVILITDQTIIEMGREALKKEDLKVGDMAVIIGSPNGKGEIEAKLIRIFNQGDMGASSTPPLPPLPFFFR